MLADYSSKTSSPWWQLIGPVEIDNHQGVNSALVPVTRLLRSSRCHLTHSQASLTTVIKFSCLSNAQASTSDNQHFLDIHFVFRLLDDTTC